MQPQTISQNAKFNGLNRKKLSDEDCLSTSLACIQEIYHVCHFYSDYKLENSFETDTTGSKLSRTISYSQMKKRQLVDKSISLYKRTKENYKHRRINSLPSLIPNKLGEKVVSKEEAVGYLGMAKKLYSNYSFSFNAPSFITSHLPSRYAVVNEPKIIEKVTLKYRDSTPLSEREVSNVIMFLKDLSKIDEKGESSGSLMKLFLKEWDKYYNIYYLSTKSSSEQGNSLNDMTPLEFMINMEMWIGRYMDFVYNTIEFLNTLSTQKLPDSLMEDGQLDDMSRFGSNTSLYSGDTAFQNSSRSLSFYKTGITSSSASTVLSTAFGGDVSSFMDDSTLFNDFELDLSAVDPGDRSTSPISERIDFLYPAKNSQSSVADQINTHNHDHCLQTIKKRTLHYFELPFPYRENKYVINGYRYYDFLDCLRSVFAFIPVLSKPVYQISKENESSSNHIYHWHNETVNIWTHLLASFFFLYKFISFKAVYKTTAQNASISAFFLMSFCCFMLSSLWHTLSGWNKVKKRSKACCLDYSGISMLIVSSIIAVQCSIVPLTNESFLQLYIWIIISLSLLVMSLVLNWHPRFDSPESRNIRILVFVSMAAVGNISIITLNPAKKGYHFGQLFKNSFAWYLLGVLFYGGFIPERFRSDCPVGRIPTMAERSSELSLIKEERSVYFKSSPYTSELDVNVAVKLEQDEEEIMNQIDESINKEIDTSSHSWSSLWWTDYYLQSHNLWHVMVIMGCLGHFKAVEKILNNAQ